MTPDDPVPSVFDLPESHWLHSAHKHSIWHRAEIEASAACGCFYSKKTFAPSEIEDWTDTPIRFRSRLRSAHVAGSIV
jgi:hypothetical protein